MNISRGSGGVGTRGGRGNEEGTVLNKGDIAKNAETTCSRVIAAVTLVLRAVTKKNTCNGLSRELRPLTRW